MTLGSMSSAKSAGSWRTRRWCCIRRSPRGSDSCPSKRPQRAFPPCPRSGEPRRGASRGDSHHRPLRRGVRRRTRARLLLTDDDHAKALVESLRRRADTFTWQETARRLRVFFDVVLHHPRSRTIVIQGEGLEAAGLASRAQRGAGMPARSAQLERFVDFVVHHPTLKDRLSPDGSKRQRAACSVLQSCSSHGLRPGVSCAEGAST